MRAYKVWLRNLIDRRPSGTRQRIAKETGTHKSFISQILNPEYRVPLPAQHIPALFRVCHFSLEEKREFLRHYADAHAVSEERINELLGEYRDWVKIALPEFRNAEIRREVETAIRENAARIILVAELASKSRKNL